MKMILPPIKERRLVDRLLSAFFRDYKAVAFKKAIAALCRFYHLKNPQVEWFEYIDWGKTAGKTYENGQIYLVHPENWKKGRKYNSERRWISTVYHEMGHYRFLGRRGKQSRYVRVANGAWPKPSPIRTVGFYDLPVLHNSTFTWNTKTH